MNVYVLMRMCMKEIIGRYLPERLGMYINTMDVESYSCIFSLYSYSVLNEIIYAENDVHFKYFYTVLHRIHTWL